MDGAYCLILAILKSLSKNCHMQMNNLFVSLKLVVVITDIYEGVSKSV